MPVNRKSIERIEETTDALQRMRTLLWSGIVQEQRLLELGRLSSFSGSESQEQAKRWERIIKIEIPRQAGYALLVLDCSRCEAFLEEAIRRCLIDSFIHMEVSRNKTACGIKINIERCHSTLTREEVTCHRCKENNKTWKLPKFSRLKEEVRLLGLNADNQGSHWEVIESLYFIRNVIVHQGGRLRRGDLDGSNQTLKKLKERYRRFELVRQDEDGSYIWITPELSGHFREATHELLSSVWSLVVQIQQE